MSSLYVREKREGRWRYKRISTGKGKKTGHIQGPFYARPFFQGKQVWKTLLATTFEEAQEEANQLTVALEAQAKGLTIAELENTRNIGRISLKSAVEKFISQAQSTKKNKTVLGYRLNLNQFVASTKIKFLDEVSKDTLCEFRDFLLRKGYGARTQHNRIITVLSLLNDNKIETDFSLRKDLPTFQEEIAAAYTIEELKKLFDAMDAEEKIRYNFFLGTGCRDQEVTYASWPDIDFEKKTYQTPTCHDFWSSKCPLSLIYSLGG